jgi:hypothetical protein
MPLQMGDIIFNVIRRRAYCREWGIYIFHVTHECALSRMGDMRDVFYATHDRA